MTSDGVTCYYCREALTAEDATLFRTDRKDNVYVLCDVCVKTWDFERRYYGEERDEI